MTEVQDTIVLKIEGDVRTDADGIQKLMHLFFDASRYPNSTITVDFYSMTWIDANLTAFFWAIGHRLREQYNVTLSADFTYLAQRFNVLFRNGWLKHDAFVFQDDEKTTIPCSSFLPTEEAEFIEYIANKLLNHRSIADIEVNIKKRIQSDLIEVFQNIYRHARTQEPCFICGQFYPRQQYFVLTIVDLGVGFLPPIEEYTNGKTNTHIEAIKWALSGESTKIKNPETDLGGFALSGILEYCQNSKGIFQIYTGTDFWGTDLEGTIWQGVRDIGHAFNGSMVNLFFNTKH